jgi:transposase
MGYTKKRKYDRYSLEYKLQTVRIADHPDVRSKDVAEALGIHPVMLYRWQMEFRNGQLRGNPAMAEKESPKRRASKPDPVVEKDKELAQAKKRIKELERALANRNDEIDLLKKAERFFEKKRK